MPGKRSQSCCRRLPQCWPNRRFFLKIVYGITFLYMLTELVIGYQFDSIVLVADSLHMFVDLTAWLITLYGEVISERSIQETRSRSFPFGLARAKFLADLSNSIILLALCLTLSLESIQRFYAPEAIGAPLLVTIVGGIGFVWNFCLVFLMERYDREKSATNSGSASDSNSKESSILRSISSHPHRNRQRYIAGARQYSKLLSEAALGVSRTTYFHPGASHPHQKKPPASDDSRSAYSSENERPDEDEDSGFAAMLAHVKGDWLVNGAVIFAGGATWLFGPATSATAMLFRSGLTKHQTQYVVYLDPLASLFVVGVLVHHTLAVVLTSSYALLQGVHPTSKRQLQNRLFRLLEPHLLRNVKRDGFGPVIEDVRLWEVREHELVGSCKIYTDARTFDEAATVMKIASLAFEYHKVATQHQTIALIFYYGTPDSEAVNLAASCTNPVWWGRPTSISEKYSHCHEMERTLPTAAADLDRSVEKGVGGQSTRFASSEEVSDLVASRKSSVQRAGSVKVGRGPRRMESRESETLVDFDNSSTTKSGSATPSPSRCQSISSQGSRSRSASNSTSTRFETTRTDVPPLPRIFGNGVEVARRDTPYLG